MEPLTITLAGVPVAKGRARFSKRSGHAYTPTKTRRYESTLRLAAQEAMLGRKMFDCALWLIIDVYVQIPASWSKKKREQAADGFLLPCSKPDLDNFQKAITDALNSVVYRDDSQIVNVDARKRYAHQPKIVVTVSAV